MGGDVVRMGRVLVAVWMAAVAWSSCDAPTEGCLDFEAVAVDVTADRACDDCCVYPSLTLNLLTGITRGDTLVQAIRSTTELLVDGDSVVFTALGFYLNDVQVEFANGEAVAVADTFSYRPGAGEALVAGPSVGLLQATPLRSFRVALPGLRTRGEVVAVSATLGLPAEVRDVDARLQGTSSPLAQAPDSLLFRAGARRLAAMRWTRDAVSDSLLVTDTDAEIRVRWQLPESFLLERASNLSVDVVLDPRSLLGRGAEVDAATFADVFLAEGVVVGAE